MFAGPGVLTLYNVTNQPTLRAQQWSKRNTGNTAADMRGTYATVVVPGKAGGGGLARLDPMPHKGMGPDRVEHVIERMKRVQAMGTDNRRPFSLEHSREFGEGPPSVASFEDSPRTASSRGPSTKLKFSILYPGHVRVVADRLEVDSRPQDVTKLLLDRLEADRRPRDDGASSRASSRGSRVSYGSTASHRGGAGGGSGKSRPGGGRRVRIRSLDDKSIDSFNSDVDRRQTMRDKKLLLELMMAERAEE